MTKKLNRLYVEQAIHEKAIRRIEKKISRIETDAFIEGIHASSIWQYVEGKDWFTIAPGSVAAIAVVGKMPSHAAYGDVYKFSGAEGQGRAISFGATNYSLVAHNGLDLMRDPAVTHVWILDPNHA